MLSPMVEHGAGGVHCYRTSLQHISMMARLGQMIKERADHWPLLFEPSFSANNPKSETELKNIQKFHMVPELWSKGKNEKKRNSLVDNIILLVFDIVFLLHLLFVL